MLVPKYWAEAAETHRSDRRQVTVRRFGWSNVSQQAASEHASERLGEALRRILAGEELARRERKVPYNGSDGLPIREEVLATYFGDRAVLTRNSYGARCLNLESVLFADIDYERETSFAFCLMTLLCGLVGLVLGALLGAWIHGSWLNVVLGFLGACLGFVLPGWTQRTYLRLKGGLAKLALTRVQRFAKAHPAWNLRLYETPAGLRVLATHRSFDPVTDQAEIEAFFRAIGADQMYVRMCRLQRCFRARLTPKPWRIGIDDHLKPRPGTWPVDPSRLPEREAWVQHYEAESRSWAACRFHSEIGSGTTDPHAAEVRDLHDRLSGANSGLPIA